MKKIKLVFAAIFIVVVLLIAFVVNKYLMIPALESTNYKTSSVDRGPVDLSVPATGIVNPGNEVLLLSPATSVVSSILLAPGSRVSRGSVILTLDPKTITREIDGMRDQLDVLENDLQKNRLNARSTRVDLDYNAEVKNLRIASLKSEIADQEQLLKVGGISPALNEQTKQELLLAEKDLNMTQEKNAIRLKQLEAEERGLQLQIDIKKKELESKLTLLGRLSIKAPSDGIILGLYANEGEKVETDKLLVKMSDLSSFKIKASADNRYMESLRTGGDALVIFDSKRLYGKIGNVSPVITDRKIDFDIFLQNDPNIPLAPNLEVDVLVVTQRKDSVLRIEQGPAFNRARHQDVYVVRDGRAVRTPFTAGLIGTDYIEVVSGLEAGDRVITSDISTFRHRKEVDFEDL